MFYIAIIGAAMFMLSRIQNKKISERGYYDKNVIIMDQESKNNFIKKIQNSFLYDLFYSKEVAKKNSRYGMLLVVVGIAGMVFFQVIGIALIVVVILCLVKLIKKFTKH